MTDFSKTAKPEVARELLKSGDIYVQFGTAFRVPGLFLPPFLRESKVTCFQVGYNMPIPIPDHRVDDFAISGTFSFSRKQYFCRVPWEAIFQISSVKTGFGRCWADDVPKEYLSEPKAERPALKLVKGGALLSKPAIGVLKLVRDEST